MRFPACILAAVWLCGCVAVKPPVTSETAAITPPMAVARIMANAAVISQPRARTNVIALAWLPSASPEVTGYGLKYGTNSGNYSVEMNVGSVTSAVVTLVSFVPTRWFFVVYAYTADGLTSPDSNEAHWPAYAPILTGFTLTGVGPVKQSRDLVNWSGFTNSLPATLPLADGNNFFRGTNLNLKANYFQPE